MREKAPLLEEDFEYDNKEALRPAVLKLAEVIRRQSALNHNHEGETQEKLAAGVSHEEIERANQEKRAKIYSEYNDLVKNLPANAIREAEKLAQQD